MNETRKVRVTAKPNAKKINRCRIHDRGRFGFWVNETPSHDGKSILFASSHRDPQLAKTEEQARREAEEDRKSGRRRRYKWDFDPYYEIYTADLDGGR